MIVVAGDRWVVYYDDRRDEIVYVDGLPMDRIVELLERLAERLKTEG